MGSILRTIRALPRRLATLAFAAAIAVLAAPVVAAPCAGFTDVEDSSFFCTNVGWLKNRAITLGCTSATLFCPNDAVIRLQMAAFMNRLGTALTPVQLRVDAAPGAIDLDANPVVCQTADFVAEDFARIAFADVRFSGNASADVGLAADLVMSTDAGVTWANLNLFSSRGFVAANQWGTLSGLGFAILDAEQSARFGVRMSRVGVPGGADLTHSRCQLRVRIYNHNEPPVNVAPVVDAGPDQGITLPATANLAGTVSDDGLPNPPAALTATWSKFSGPGVVTFGNANIAVTSASFSDAGTYVLRLTANDSVLNASDDVTIVVNAQGTLPPNPETVATPVEPGVVSDISDDTRFLYTEPTPIQTDVVPGTIDRVRAAVLRGRVLDRAGNALSGVAISVLDHPELGRTLSRADGRFDLAVNGGATLILNYVKPGFLPAQRQARVPVRDYRVLDDLIMIPVDSRVTAIAANAAAMQVHQGNRVTDGDGSRTSTLLVPAGTTATLVMPDGSSQPIGTLNVRATEYTVGTSGPGAMPAPLPPASGYTYAVELSADEALASGARTVQFNQPLFNYVDNFLGFPIGMAVPTAFYDRTKAAWIPSTNGRVIRITAIDASGATVDSVGTGTLPALVLSAAERQQLAQLYTVGQALWRVPIAHFTPWDHNWPFGPPTDAAAPLTSGPIRNDELDDATCSAGSIIECENQALGETIGVVGSRNALHYRSTRTPGRSGARTLRIPLSGASVPASLKRIDLDVQVAGQRFQQSFGPGGNQQTVFAWDGKDAYGRALPGRQPVTVGIDYVYDGVFRTPADGAASFGLPGDVAISGSRSRGEITLGRSFITSVGALDARVFGLGGWSLTSHHVYDPQGRLLYLGSGRRRGVDSLGAVIQTVPRENPIGTPAPFQQVQSVAVGADGSLYIAGFSSAGSPVRRVFPGGLTVGFGTISNVNGLRYVLTVGPDGSVYVAQSDASQLDRVMKSAPDGTTSVFAGRDDGSGFEGDGGPATFARFDNIRDIAAAADGSLYVLDHGNERIRRIGTDGIVTTIAGNGLNCDFPPCGEGGPATQAALDDILSVAASPDGTVYVLEHSSRRIRRVGADGIISTHAGNGDQCNDVPLPCGDGGPATQAALGGSGKLAVGPDGAVYYAETASNRVRRIGADGIIDTVAGRGDGKAEPFVEGMPATQAQLVGSVSPDVAVAADGTLYISAGVTLRKVVSALPTLSLTESAVAFDDGRELYIFDLRGRHLRTVDALTGTTLLEFDYDATGRLDRVVEKTGGTDNITTIERDPGGSPTAIVGPFGQRTILGVDANGFLASIANPAGERVQLASTAEGLLTNLTDPRGKISTFVYDTEGKLIRDSDPAGGFQTLARSELTDGFTVARSTVLSRTTSYNIDNLPGGVRKRTLTAPDGTQALDEETIDAGTRKLTEPNGTVTNFERGPDPRFGMQAPIAKSLSVVVPGGPTLTAASTLTAVLSDPADVLSLTSLTGTSTVDGRTTTNVYTAATRTEVTTTPAGRTGRYSLDTLGRSVQMEAGGLAPTTFTYDTRGRLATMIRGSGVGARTFVFAYDPQGFLATITDPIGRTVQLSRDAAGRAITKTLPGGRVVGFGYDAAGNITSLTPPGRPAHTFGYSDRNELTVATPPSVPGTGPIGFSYNADKQITTTARPDNRSIVLGYDGGGRRATRSFTAGGVTTATDAVSYDASGRVASVAAATGITTSYTYAGTLIANESWAGTTAGSVSRTYDASFRLASQSVNGANTIAFGYDDDSLMVNAGDLAIARDPQHGLVTGSTLGVVSTTSSYNGFGEPSGYIASANAASIYNVQFVRDGLGRISQKTETIGGVTDMYAYTYDAVGQVSAVTKNGTTVESYGYDANGNRTSATVGGVSTTAAYDDQDRLTRYGTDTYTYTAAGELLTKSAGGQVTSYQYDPLGSLTAVTLPGGTSITYVVDGHGRRVGKRINAAPVKGFLYNDRLRPVAELDGTGTLVSRFVHAGRHTPAYVIKGGVTHRILVDHLGSVRLVVNAVTGAIAQQIDYDTFGNVILDTNPGFQPFGFAGGLYDPDTGLVRFGARDYDSSTGRWTAKDPIGFAGRDSNLYRYARGNPVNVVDATGMGPEEDALEEAQSFVDEVTEVELDDIKNDTPTPRQLRNLLEKAERIDIQGMVRQVAREMRELRRRTFSGGVLGVCFSALQAVDLFSSLKDASENNRTLLEQGEFEEQEAIDRGARKFLNCLGPFCYVKEII